MCTPSSRIGLTAVHRDAIDLEQPEPVETGEEIRPVTACGDHAADPAGFESFQLHAYPMIVSSAIASTVTKNV